MSRHNVPVKLAGEPGSKGVLRSIESAVGSIRRRAYDLFHLRGEAPRADLDDWFRAERELFHVPPCELVESANEFALNLAAPGFEPDQLEVAVDSGTVTIHGHSEHKREKTAEREVYSELTRKDLIRRFTLPAPIDTDHAHAYLSGGYLKINLPKQSPAA